jgi:hypothetical protein
MPCRPAGQAWGFKEETIGDMISFFQLFEHFCAPSEPRNIMAQNRYPSIPPYSIPPLIISRETLVSPITAVADSIVIAGAALKKWTPRHDCDPIAVLLVPRELDAAVDPAIDAALELQPAMQDQLGRIHIK